MRIAFVYDLVYPYTKGGVEKRISELARRLTDRGHRVEVLSTKLWPGPDRHRTGGVTYSGISPPAELHDRRGRRSIKQAVRFAFDAAVAVARGRYDVVEVQGMTPLTCLAVTLAARLTRQNVVVVWYEVWGDYWNDYLGLLGYLGRLVEWLVVRFAPTHVAVSGLAARRLDEFGVASVAHSPIGIDLPSIEAAPPALDRFDIVYVGRLVAHKNVGLLIQALGLLSERGFAFDALIVGDGPQRPELEARARRIGSGRIEFAGRIEDDAGVYSLMKSAQVFAFPSLREGFGIAVLEAAACGLPVVVVEHPDNASVELVEAGRTGLVAGGDPVGFANALERLLTDTAYRSGLSRQAARNAARYDWPVLVGDAERALLGSRHREGRERTKARFHRAVG